MGMTTAIKTRQIIENANFVLALELMAGAQAVDFRKPIKPGEASRITHDIVRKYVKHLEEDRPIYDDINKLTAVVKSGEILDEVRKDVITKNIV